MGKYITKSDLQDLINAVTVEDNEYISTDKLIRLLRNAEGFEIPPVREIDTRIDTLNYIIKDTQLKDKPTFIEIGEHLGAVTNTKIEKLTAAQSDECKITRQTLGRWEESMKKLKYLPCRAFDMSNKTHPYGEAILQFLTRMKKDQNIK